MIRPLSARRDLEGALFVLFLEAREAGLEAEAIEEIVRRELGEWRRADAEGTVTYRKPVGDRA